MKFCLVFCIFLPVFMKFSESGCPMTVGFHENRCSESRELLYLEVYMYFFLCFSHLVSVLGEFRYKSSENNVAERLWVPKTST